MQLAGIVLKRSYQFDYFGMSMFIDDDTYCASHIGLLHDIGHGPFSHLFEREFLPKVQAGSEWYGS